MVSVLFATIQSCPSRRKSPARWLASVAFVLGACSLVGCDRSPGAIGAVDVVAKVASDDPVSASSNGQSGLRENGDIYASASQRFEHDAGLTLAGNVLSHSFTIANSWGGDVSVRDEEDDIIVNCGCTKFSLAKYQLAPGESTTVDVSLDQCETTGFVGEFGCPEGLDSCDFSYTSPDEPGAPVVPVCVCNAGSICANNQPQVICSG